MLSEKQQALYTDLIATAKGARTRNVELSLAQLMRELNHDTANAFYLLLDKLQTDQEYDKLTELDSVLSSIGVQSKRLKAIKAERLKAHRPPLQPVAPEPLNLGSPVSFESMHVTQTLTIEDPVRRLMIEADAVSTIIKSLAQVSEDSRIRVIKSAITLLGMTALIEVER